MRFPLALALILATQLAAAEPDRPLDEYQVKAAFLYNFARFVDWPPQAFAGPNEPLLICVLGEDPFGKALDNAVDGRKIEGRAIAVRRISDAHATRGCHMLFVSASERKRVLTLLASASGSGLLTVGDSDSATAEGMIINFILDGDKVRFAINVAAAERQKLRFSSRLLSLAVSVKR